MIILIWFWGSVALITAGNVLIAYMDSSKQKMENTTNVTY